MNSFVYLLILLICILLIIAFTWKLRESFKSSANALISYKKNYATALSTCGDLTISTTPNYYVNTANVSFGKSSSNIYYILFKKLTTTNSTSTRKSGDVDLTDASISNLKAVSIIGQNVLGNMKLLMVLCFPTNTATLEKDNTDYSGRIDLNSATTDYLSSIYYVKNDIYNIYSLSTIKNLKSLKTLASRLLSGMQYLEIRLHT